MNPPEPAASPLPPDLDSLIERTVKRARLRASERDDVARELRSHFAEALADGTPIEDVVAAFGDPAAAGRLIGRAKRRCRGLAWHAWVWSCRSVGALFSLILITYAWAAVQYYRPVRVSGADYELRMAEAMKMTKEHAGDAWKVLRSFRESIPADWDQRRVTLTRVDHWSPEEWAEAASLVEMVRPSLDEALPALAAGSLGYTLEDWRADSYRGTAYRQHMLLTAHYPMLWDLFAVTNWMRLDFELAERTGDVARAESLTSAFADAAQLCDQMTIALCQETCTAWAVHIARWTLQETTAHGVHRIRDLGRLQTVLHRLRKLADSYAIDTELISLEDYLAHLYGGDEPSGRISAAGWAGTLGDPRLSGETTSAPWWWPGALMETPLAPVLSLGMPTFGESVTEVREYFLKCGPYISTPLWVDFDDVFREPYVSEKDPWDAYQGYATQTMLSAFSGGRQHRAVALSYVDAALAALAIAEYQRDHGVWPPNLEALVPTYLPHLPIDQFTGQPPRYRITVEGPVLYSVGVDRDDDGGLPIVNEKGMIDFPVLIDPGTWAQYDADRQARMDGDWILWPVCECPDTPVWSYADPAE